MTAIRRRYIVAMTIPKTIKAGRVLMHNSRRHTVSTPSGVGGFVAWTDTQPPPGFVACRCGWSGLPHYRPKPQPRRSA
jgi:hypothetical protein